ncbi:MAG: hypothetical protein WCT05_01935 [Lentisphaeria bacterium]
MEKNYEFRSRLDQVHRPGFRNADATVQKDEIALDVQWVISDPGTLFGGCAALDLQDYLQRCMGLSLPIRETGEKQIVLTEVAGEKGFFWEITPERITLQGNTRKGVYYLEDLMNFREAPFFSLGKGRRDPLFYPRMVHSGWAQDVFPDSHLNAIAHAGFDCILLFVVGVNQTTYGYLDFNDLIRRAGNFGLGVYFYSYLDSFKHPDDPDADEFFERNFGAVFANSPEARGLILVGESCAFPSKDPRSGLRNQDGIRRRAGFFPSDDYPQWLQAVTKAVRRHAPQADVVFWTYNWGNSPETERLALIEKLPLNVSLQVTFEMYEQIQYPNHTMKVPDYTITFPGPGFYFRSEAAAAAQRGLPLYTITNTAGATWDCGVMPYIPVPQQWFRRFRAMHEAREKWGLSGLMDSHHYGWFPNPIAECAKWNFWAPVTDPEVILRKIAVRDFGKAAAEQVLSAWQIWSDAMASFTPGFDDQCGPLRIGPSYPFIFYPVFYPFAEQNMKFPFSAHAYRGERILNTLYKPEHVSGHTNIGCRIHEDLKIMQLAEEKWGHGVATMKEALKLVPENKKQEAQLQAGTGEFFWHTLRTMVGIKHWWLLNKQLEIEADFNKAREIVAELQRILAKEEKNVRETIPLVEADSRLGWEPTLEYATDRPHLEWKLKQIDRVAKWTLPRYLETIRKF